MSTRRRAVPFVVLVACLAAPISAGAAPRDRNHDGLPDSWEHRYHVSKATGDPDHDGLVNLREYRAGTDPRRADTDHDGIKDGAEVLKYKTNPRRADSDGDGYSDLAELRAGTNPLGRMSRPATAPTTSKGDAPPAAQQSVLDPIPTVVPIPTIVPIPTVLPTPTPTPTATPTPPPDYTPRNLKATVDSKGTVHLDWDDTTDPNFAWYGVRRSTDPSSDKATWTRLAPNYTTSQATDSGLAAGTYYYYVTERSQDGTVSGRSNVASATVAAATPTPTPSPTPTPTPTATPTPTPTPTPTGSCATSTPNVPDGPDPWGGCFPGPSNTGVPAGATLTNYTGPCTITQANTVIDSKTVDCYLEIEAKNVVIRNSLINGHVWIDDPGPAYSFTITDSTVDAGPVDANHNDGNKAIGKSHFTALRVETIRGVSGIFCEYDCTVKDSYVHGQDKDEGGAAHESGVRMGSGAPGAGQYFTHNTIECDAPDVQPDAGCSADLTGYGDFDTIQNNTVANNLFPATTGGTCAYGGSTSGKPYPNGNNNVFQNNIFEHKDSFQKSGKCGVWYAIVDLDAGKRGNQWVNNRWDDGGLMPSEG